MEKSCVTEAQIIGMMKEEISDTLDGARSKHALWRYNYDAVRPRSSLGSLTPLETSPLTVVLPPFHRTLR